MLVQRALSLGCRLTVGRASVRHASVHNASSDAVKQRLRALAMLAWQEGLVLKDGLVALWHEIKYDMRRPQSSMVAPAREARLEARLRWDILAGLPAAAVLAVIPGSALLLMAATKWAPWALPSTFAQVRSAIAYREPLLLLREQLLAPAAIAHQQAHGHSRDLPALLALQVALQHAGLALAGADVERLGEQCGLPGAASAPAAPLLLLFGPLTTTTSVGLPPAWRYEGAAWASFSTPEGGLEAGGTSQSRLPKALPFFRAVSEKCLSASSCRRLCHAASRAAAEAHGALQDPATAGSVLVPLPPAVSCCAAVPNPPATPFHAVAASDLSDSAAAEECIEGAAAYAAAVAADDWLLRRELWLKAGLWDPKREMDGEWGELAAACAQRFLPLHDTTPECAMANGRNTAKGHTASMLSPRAVLQRRLAAWLQLSALVPMPLLLAAVCKKQSSSA